MRICERAEHTIVTRRQNRNGEYISRGNRRMCRQQVDNPIHEINNFEPIAVHLKSKHCAQR